MHEDVRGEMMFGVYGEYVNMISNHKEPTFGKECKSNLAEDHCAKLSSISIIDTLAGK